MMKHDAVVAMGMGGPDSVDDIKPFLTNLLNDRELINFGVGAFLQSVIVNKIVNKRFPIVKPMYEKMGGASPQLMHTNNLLAKLPALYEKSTNRKLAVYAGMCYWEPYIEESLTDAVLKRYDTIYLFPLYPQYSTTTTAACFSRTDKILKRAVPKGRIVEIYSYHMNKRFLKMIAQRINDAADKLGCEMGDVHLLFSAHSLPESVIAKGDPYVTQLLEQVEALTAMLNPKSYSLSYQSKLGRMKWLTPSTESELLKLKESGVKNIVVHAISFVNDHIETLIELDDDLLMKGRSDELNICRTESLNDADEFAETVINILTGDRLYESY